MCIKVNLYLSAIVSVKLFTTWISIQSVQERSFAVGYTFWYWDYYKFLDHIDEKDEHIANINDFFGHKPKDLYVEAKWTNLGEEIMYNKIETLSFSNWNESKKEVKKRMNTTMHKSIKCQIKEDQDGLHYGIAYGSVMEYQHIQSVVLYCNFSDLSTAFSATFRKMHPFESLKSLKKRNSEFGHMSRLLRETVEYFGQRGMGEWDEKSQKYPDGTKIGKRFFCGMNFVMAIPEFNIRLCGPTSTSICIEVFYLQYLNLLIVV